MHKAHEKPNPLCFLLDYNSTKSVMAPFIPLHLHSQRLPAPSLLHTVTQRPFHLSQGDEAVLTYLEEKVWFSKWKRSCA